MCVCVRARVCVCVCGENEVAIPCGLSFTCWEVKFEMFRISGRAEECSREIDPRVSIRKRKKKRKTQNDAAKNLKKKKGVAKSGTLFTFGTNN